MGMTNPTNEIKDWTENTKFRQGNIRTTKEAETHDYYATDPKAVEILLKNEKFSKVVWECACGEGHISKVLENDGYEVVSTDLVYRGFGRKEPLDFLKSNGECHCDIVTNPPYKYAKEFVQKAMKTVTDGHKVAMLLKLTFLEGKSRKELFEKYLPETVYVFSSRVDCGKNGKFVNTKAVAYCWFVWRKGFKGDPVIKWVN